MVVRDEGEGLVITTPEGTEISITVLDGSNVCLGIDAPRQVQVERTEVEASRRRHPSQPAPRAI